MTGRVRQSWRRTGLLAVLAGGVFAFLLPSAVAIQADEKAPVKAETNVPATKPATTQAKSKEAKEAEDIAKVMDFFNQTQPDVYEKARRLRETDPAKFKELVRPVIPVVNGLDDIKKKDPEFYGLKIKDYQLTFQKKSMAEQLRRSDLAPADRDKIMADLGDLVSRQFDVQQDIKKKEIASIEERVKNLQAQLEERETNKDKIIKRQINDLAPPAATIPATAQKTP